MTNGEKTLTGQISSETFRTASPAHARKKSRLLGFTLVELIVVITILAVLATVGFLSLSGYTDDARSATVAANVRTVYSAILTESTTSGNSPRYYVDHDPAAALSGGVAFVDGQQVVLTGGQWGSGGTNYSAGNPRWDRLKMNGDKFRLAFAAPGESAGFGSLAFEARAAYDTGAVSVGAFDASGKATLTGKSKPVTYFQVVGVSPSTKKASVTGNYLATVGGVTGLVRDASQANPTAAVSDTAATSGYLTIAGNDSAGRKWSDGTYGVSCGEYKAPPLGKSYAGAIGDGTYWIDPDGTGGNAEFKAYCDMTSDGGGWTLAMKQLSSGSALSYDSAYWDDTNLLNAGSTDLSDADAKFAPFAQSSGNQFRFCLNNSWWKCVTKNYAGTLRSFVQLQTSLQIGYPVGATTDPAANAWIEGLGFSNAGIYAILCNGHHSGSYTFVRVGVNSNDSVAQGCNSSDDFVWGFGLKNTQYASNNFGAGWTRTTAGGTAYQGAIFVR